jgi:hypothetical protein
VRAELERPPATGTFCSLYHQRLPAYDQPLDPGDFQRARFLWPEGERELSRAVDVEYGSGERAFVALDCEPPVLGFAVRLLARRVVVP